MNTSNGVEWNLNALFNLKNKFKTRVINILTIFTSLK